jgi:hypothetical protein
MAKNPIIAVDIVVFYATPGCEAGFSKAALKTVMLFFHLNYGILLTGFKLVCKGSFVGFIYCSIFHASASLISPIVVICGITKYRCYLLSKLIHADFRSAKITK